ncbi:hypothetical protein VA7868_02336 [Vibrio aerogenes CECT 7868]|uniref:Contractile injection system tube protein N-terminal domain-containing protein n=1 Tax=Vibrio aerogenes CECT 7868 TaxID=1216006 RepID=A0A1M5Z5Z0_9VIBR|nr:hypothetical protein [Vibrio aerogenes]SHI19695.1 hypothetical protein VA7868_02336 [Vibrio aerogenes CECT 7868]
MMYYIDPTVPMVHIAAYKKVDGGSGDLVGSIHVPYQKSSLVVDYQNCIHPEITATGSGSVTHFSHSEPSCLKLTLLLDNTIITTPEDLLTPDRIDNTIKTLIGLSHTIAGSEHRPHFIRVIPMMMPLDSNPTGGFGGFLSDMTIKNEIIDSFGNRIKASVDLTVTECHSLETANKLTNRSSPDLTHELQMVDGDHLVNRVQRIYGSGEYVHAVAESNQLNSIRELTPGQWIRFPPLDR